METKNKILGMILCMLMIASVVPISGLADQTTEKSSTSTASELMQPSGTQSKPITLNNQATYAPMYEQLTRGNYPAPDFNFTKLPTTMMLSYYDYMISNYNSHAIKKQTENGAGEYIWFHAKPASTGNRKAYYSYVDASQNVQTPALITTYDRQQGFGGIGIHPATGDAIASWHENADGDTPLETTMTYDDFDTTDTPGHWQTPTIIDNNSGMQYQWPMIYVGPSPDEGYVRVYQVCTNGQQLPDTYPCEDVRLRYTDIINDNGVSLADLLNNANWNMVTIFTDWRPTEVRPYQSFAIDYNTPGKVAFIGYASYILDNGNEIVDEGMFYWESLDYGETWDYANFYTDGPSAPLYQVTNPGFEGAPALLDVDVAGFHDTALFDAEGNIHWTFMQSYGYSDDVGSYYFPYYLPQAEAVWDGTGFTFHEVPQLPGIDATSGHSVPWIDIDNTYPTITYSTYIAGTASIFHENCQKQAINKENNWIAQVWVDGTKAQLGTDGDPDYTAYINHPIISIAVSPDNGLTWAEPVELTDIYSTLFDFSGQITVYPFVCDKITDLGDNWGQIDMIYMDDNTFGSSIQGSGGNTGGNITFCSVKIKFPEVGAFIADAGGPYEAFVGEDIQFLGGVTGGTAPYTWHWAFGDGDTADVPSPIHAYDTAETYTVTLTVTDALAQEAVDTTTATITVELTPNVEIGAITGGLLQVGAEIKSTGNTDATNIIWTMTVKGGILGLINISVNGTIVTLGPGDSEIGIAKPIFGLGKITINVTAVADDIAMVEKSATAIVLGPFVLGVKEV